LIPDSAAILRARGNPAASNKSRSSNMAKKAKKAKAAPKKAKKKR
jgi:hypothetical protein